ncbi:MAG: DNA/RNA non-specific endonuclease [Elusimicrobia bacterium]|nr:DNA/RNA non-specific endonuclease [Elusimicrobiota bacterium]
MMISRIRLLTLGLLLSLTSLCLATPRDDRDDELAKWAPTKDYYARPFGLVSFNGMTRTSRYTLEWLDRHSKTRDRGSIKFHKDPDVPNEFGPSPADYAGANVAGRPLDIGHQAAYGNHGQSQDEADSTETLANACPQYAGFNRGKWKSLEELNRQQAQRLDVDHLLVFTAPAWIVEADMIHISTIGKHHVWVPTHCIKSVLIFRTDRSIEALCWRLPNDPEASASLDEYLVSIDDAEGDLGLDLWPAFSADDERRFERRAAK